MTSASSNRATSSFRTDVHGLRAIAVAIVVLYHSGVSALSGGYVGVDVFFVISGFLITSHLLREVDRTGKLHFGKFYVRRVKRLLPAALTVIVLTVIAAFIWMPPLQITEMLKGAAASALYGANFLFAIDGVDYLAETAPNVFQHYWSLGVEEQFYLVWPAVFLLLIRWSRGYQRRLIWSTVALSVLSLIGCIVVTARLEPIGFFMLPTRAWEFGVGAIVALIVAQAPSWLANEKLGWLSWAGVATLVVCAFAYTADVQFPGYAALGPVLGTAFVVLGGAGGSTQSPTRLLSTAPFRFLGDISYSLYLVHWPLLVIPQAAVGLNNKLPLAVTLALGLISVPIAWLSYRYIETPTRNHKLFTQWRARTTLACTLGLSIIVAGVAITVDFTIQRVPLSSDQVASAFEPTLSPPASSAVPNNLRPSIRSVDGDNGITAEGACHRQDWETNSAGCRFGSNEEAPLVALFGDSHAGQWYPALRALADDGMIRLDMYSKSRCSSGLTHRTDYPECTTWQKGVLKNINDTQPDVVLLGNYTIAQVAVVAGENDRENVWQKALTETIDALPEGTTPVVIADTPQPRNTPAICLSTNLQDASSCDLARDSALYDDLREAETKAVGNVIDFTDYLCNEESCPVIIDDLLVYRDGSHITGTAAAELAPVFREKLAQYLP